MPQFLSDEWIEAAQAIRADLGDSAPALAQQVQVNLTVKSAPFGDGVVQAHLDTTGEGIVIGQGHLDGAATTVTTDYDTARKVFIEQDQQGAMVAFMSGKVQIAGDMSKMMMLMQGAPDPAALEIAARIKAITD